MLSRERVIEVIHHRKPDRIPVYAWVRINLKDQITEKFGSVEAFEDKYEFDFAHLFGGPGPYAKEDLDGIRARKGGPVEPADLLEISLCDPNNDAAYDGLRQMIDHYKIQRGRFVYVQTPGIFECLNGPFGIENHLLYLAMYSDTLHEVYRRQAEWNKAFAMNCLDLGVDMIHVSDDWGSQRSLLFRPETWRELIFPYHKITCDAVRRRGGYLSLHCDGNFNSVLDGVAELGYQVVHPWQESAGMDYQTYKTRYSKAFVLMGGLCVQTTVGFGNYEHLRSEILRVLEMFKDGGMLYCTSHFIQAHCTMDELTFAYDLIYETVRKLGRG